MKKGDKSDSYKTIEELFSGFNWEYSRVEVEWGKDVGAEILEPYIDPFYSKPNQDRLEKAVKRLNAGKGIEHPIIE
jgi:hypothetical protein